jgi:hypothetical protein
MKFSHALASAGVLSLLFGISKAADTNANVPGVPVSMVVTAEAKKGRPLPTIQAADVSVREGKEKRPVTGLTPFGQNGGTMDLLLLLDDSARGSFDTQINTLKQFVRALPPTTSIGIGYMRNGTNQMVANFTRDHASAANSIRLVLGSAGADVSPYDSLSDAIKRWPASGAERREVIMISSGLESLGGGFTSDNPYVNKGISDAQRAGVVVYTIYTPAAGHFGHGYWRSSWGQNFLSQLADETGGESYMIGFGSPVSFQPFLDEITEHLRHQYRLTFEARAEKKSGLQPIRVDVVEKDASLAAPDKVFVKAST